MRSRGILSPELVNSTILPENLSSSVAIKVHEAILSVMLFIPNSFIEAEMKLQLAENSGNIYPAEWMKYSFNSSNEVRVMFCLLLGIVTINEESIESTPSASMTSSLVAPIVTSSPTTPEITGDVVNAKSDCLTSIVRVCIPKIG